MSYIDPGEMSNRQNWAAGALAEKFYTDGTLNVKSDEKDRDAASFLEKYGYNASEITPLINHMNACTDIVTGLTEEQYAEVKKAIVISIGEKRHVPPAPQ